ncbi:MAG: SDR family NAD(P)-dependent oxidoreductase [Clostridia bacterium]|nr:SDR family NAD(P)-dependent oxidoreductase [Clostridia bacterium]
MKDTYFENKIAVVTGAGGILCSEIAIQLALLGTKVYLIGRTEEKLVKTAEKINALGGTPAVIYACDVTDQKSIAELAKLVEADGGCDFLINGAGGNNVKAMPTITKYDPRELTGELPEGDRGLYDIDMDAFQSVLNINTMGTVIPTMEFAKQMIKKGGGSVINFASMNTYCPLTRCFAYAMSKAAVSNLTQSFAAYYAPAKVRINAIAPGFMVNERSKNYLGTVEDGLTKRGESVINHTPMGRFGEAGDLIGCVKWLLDDRAAGFVTGITVPVDGGFLTLGGV